MDLLLKKILEASGIPGYEGEIAKIMQGELKKSCDEVAIDNFGNVIARKGKGKKKIMIAAHMDEVGFMVKHISKEGYVYFIKIGGIDDRVLPAQKVIIKAKKGDCFGIIGTKPPHLQNDEERKHPLKYEDMFIDIGCKNREETEKKIEIVMEPRRHSKNIKGGRLEGRMGRQKPSQRQCQCGAHQDKKDGERQPSPPLESKCTQRKFISLLTGGQPVQGRIGQYPSQHALRSDALINNRTIERFSIFAELDRGLIQI